MTHKGNDDPAAAIYLRPSASSASGRSVDGLKMPAVDFIRTTYQTTGNALSQPEMQKPVVEDLRNGENWYALQVRPRFEKIVAIHLNHKGYEEYLPLYRSRRKWSDRIKEVDLPLFPGYIFCKFDVRQRLPILVVPGVMSIVGLGRNPVAVPDYEIAAVQNVVKSGLTYEPSSFLSAGQWARIERGPLRGLVGLVVATKKNCRLVISVNLLQRSVAVEIDNDSVMPLPVDNHRGAVAARA
jgi:transcription antitermination factor NusG